MSFEADTPNLAELKPLHPRAIRMGLERILEHGRVAPQASVLLDQVFNALFASATPISKALQAHVARFQECQTPEAREAWLQQLYQFK